MFLPDKKVGRRGCETGGLKGRSTVIFKEQPRQADWLMAYRQNNHHPYTIMSELKRTVTAWERGNYMVDEIVRTAVRLPRMEREV